VVSIRLFIIIILIFTYLFLFLQHDNSEASKSSSAMAAKTVKRSDLIDEKLYLPAQFVQLLNPVVGIQEVTVRDDQMRSYTMHLCVRRDGRAYLGQGWRQFFQEKRIREGDTLTFSDLNRGDAEARLSFKITHPVLDLNGPPPPEN
jgi:hypothetical protein